MQIVKLQQSLLLDTVNAECLALVKLLEAIDPTARITSIVHGEWTIDCAENKREEIVALLRRLGLAPEV